MTKLAHYFTLLYYKMLIMELLPKIDLLLPDIAAVTLIAMPAIMTAPITQAATIFTILKAFFLSIGCSAGGM